MLAAVAVRPVDEAVPLAGTRVGRIVLLAPSEETLKMPPREGEYRRAAEPTEQTGHQAETKSVTLHPSQVMTP